MGIDAVVEPLKTIPDGRRGRAVQPPLWVMLLMTLLGVMSGYSSLRGLADLMQRRQQEVADDFGLNQAKLPCYSTLREMTQSVDGTAVAAVFQAWAKTTTPVEAGQAVAMDGKALGRTVQDFVMVVSACVQSWAGVIGPLSFHNGKSSEIGAVRALLQQLDLKGVWVTLDALHCQKNGGTNCGE